MAAFISDRRSYVQTDRQRYIMITCITELLTELTILASIHQLRVCVAHDGLVAGVVALGVAQLLVALLFLLLLLRGYVFRLGISLTIFFDFIFIGILVAHHERSRLAVQGVRGVRVEEKLGQEHLKDIHKVEHWAPGLVDHIQADRTGHLIDIGVIDLVGEANGRGFVRVSFGEFNPDLPHTTLVNTCSKETEEAW